MSLGARPGPRILLTAALLLALGGTTVLQAEDPLKALRSGLEEKNAEAVLLASLDLDPLPAAAAPLLASGAQLANAGKDSFLAMQLCQRALKVAPNEAEALLACITAARALDQFDPALEWMRALRKAHPGDVRGMLWEARLLEAEGDWKSAQAAARRLEKKARTPELKVEARGIADRSETRQAELSAAKTEVATLMEALAKARAERAKTPETGRAGPTARRQRKGGEGVTIYTTRWCGYCKTAKKWMKKRGVRFRERDIEKDPQAATDLAAKAAEQRVRVGGVPVFEVEGELMGGWSEKGLKRLLERHGLL